MKVLSSVSFLFWDLTINEGKKWDISWTDLFIFLFVCLHLWSTFYHPPCATIRCAVYRDPLRPNEFTDWCPNKGKKDWWHTWGNADAMSPRNSSNKDFYHLSKPGKAGWGRNSFSLIHLTDRTQGHILNGSLHWVWHANQHEIAGKICFTGDEVWEGLIADSSFKSLPSLASFDVFVFFILWPSFDMLIAQKKKQPWRMCPVASFSHLDINIYFLFFSLWDKIMKKKRSMGSPSDLTPWQSGKQSPKSSLMPPTV